MNGEKKQIVVIGGGTGTYTVLRGLARYQKQVSLTAIVTMADSGGSTGRLRDEFGFLPVGDVRMALTALASHNDAHEELLRELFLYRFYKGGEGLSGHNFGNLLLVALTDILGSEAEAIKAAARVLQLKGQVIPVTTETAHLTATYSDGVEVVGEHVIDEPPLHRHTKSITRLSLTPKVTISELAEDALLQADMIVLGPGDLYTSVLANIVVDGVAEAIRNSGATVVYIANLMTKVGQTSGMGVKEHVAEISKYLSVVPQHVLVNTTAFPSDLQEKYASQAEFPVEANDTGNEMYTVLKADLLAVEAVKTVAGDMLKRSLLRHDPRKLARKIIEII